MKFLKASILFCLILALLSCHNKKNEKENPTNSEIKNQTTEISGFKETEINAQENLQPIEKVVKEMLITSPRFIQLTKGLQEKLEKNEGLYFGIYLESSPERKKGKEGSYSKTYDFTLYEMYEERQVITSRFSFNPDLNQLFEYDILNDSLISLEFDKTLLARFNSMNN